MNFFLVILIFDRSKTIFVILEVQFHHEGGLSGSRYLGLFFSAWPIFSPYQKSASTEAPFNLFWTLTVILTIFAFWKIYEKNLVQNLGHYHLEKCKISCLGGLLKEKQESTFDLFSNFQKPYRPSCRIVQWWQDFDSLKKGGNFKSVGPSSKKRIFKEY